MSAPRPPVDPQLLIEQSWQRCRDWGLQPADAPQSLPWQGEALRAWQTAHQALVNLAQPLALASLDSRRGRDKCLIRLADPHARTLATWGQLQFVDPQRAPSLGPGACWAERAAGTNAIGTALACGHAVHVEHDQHFLKANRFMSGSAAPILDAERQIVGALDVCSDSYLPPSHTLGLARMLSQSLENNLILARYAGTCWQLVFNPGKDNLDSPWAGLLAFNERGQVLAANRRADTLLGLDPVGVAIDTLFSTRLATLLGEATTQPFALQALARNRFQCLLRPPRETCTTPTRAHPPAPAGPEPIAIALATPLAQAGRLLEKDIPLLIQGETGVGKEFFVKALHRASTRANAALVAVNCAAIPAELVESELFGYERGAFTGAHHKGSAGLIRKADKGVLFLDEIGDMPLATQARLLRVLQERTIQPLGGGEPVTVDIRIVCASHQDLRAMVAAGRFREDLYYRINGLCLVLPALRDRADKRQVMAQIWSECREPHQPAVIPEAILARLVEHPWPGNLRQLHSVIRVTLAMANGTRVEVEDLPAQFLAEAALPALAPIDPDADADLAALLKANDGNISQLARRLGVSRNTLYKRLREDRSCH